MASSASLHGLVGIAAVTLIASVVATRPAPPLAPAPPAPHAPPPPPASPVRCVSSSAPVHDACATSFTRYLEAAVVGSYDNSHRSELPDYACDNACDALDVTYQLGFAPETPPTLAYFALLHANDYDRVANAEALHDAIEQRLATVSVGAAADYLARGLEYEAACALNGNTAESPDYRAVSDAFDRAYPHSTHRSAH